MKALHVHASTLAGLLGRHPYCKRHESFDTLWNRIDPRSFAEAHVRNFLMTPDQQKDRLASRIPEVAQAMTLQDIGAVATLTTPLVNDTVLTKEEKRDALASIQRSVYTNYGIARELETLETVRRITKLDLVDGNTSYYKARIGSLKTLDIFVGGKIDAISKDGTVVIEIKNRIKKLFMKVPEYENIQVQAYLALFPKATHALLVESLNSVPSINIMHVERDTSFWTLLCRETCSTLSLLLQMVEDHSLQDAYLTSKQRSAFLQRRLPADPSHS